MDGSVNFYRPWNQYKRGFGNVEGEYWLGLENMYQLTRNRKYMLRVDLEDFQGIKFLLCTRTSLWVLKLTGIDSMFHNLEELIGDSLSFHDGQKFTTIDKDQDSYESNCARQYLGAFWYNSCHGTNPNGVYLWGKDPTIFAIGNVWQTWKGFSVGMKTIRMKIKRVS